MLAWLGGWLQGIVAVILLAVVMELILPNNKMLRYSRLVIGLILLLTMLNPILKIFQQDFKQKISASFSLWDEQFQKDSIKVPSLDEINRKAANLIEEREQASEQLTQNGLEEAMKLQLEQQGQLNVMNVDVQLGWKNAEQSQRMPFIQQVIVTLKLLEQTGESSTVTDKIVEDVQIDIKGISEIDSTGKIVEQDDVEAGTMIKANDQQVSNVVAILTSSWNVNPNQIIVQAKG